MTMAEDRNQSWRAAKDDLEGDDLDGTPRNRGAGQPHAVHSLEPRTEGVLNTVLRSSDKECDRSLEELERAINQLWAETSPGQPHGSTAPAALPQPGKPDLPGS